MREKQRQQRVTEQKRLALNDSLLDKWYEIPENSVVETTKADSPEVYKLRKHSPLRNTVQFEVIAKHELRILEENAQAMSTQWATLKPNSTKTAVSHIWM